MKPNSQKPKFLIHSAKNKSVGLLPTGNVEVSSAKI